MPPCKHNNYLWRRIRFISRNLMSGRNFYLHDRNTNRFTNGGDNIFTCLFGRRFNTRDFQTISAHVLGNIFVSVHYVCSTLVNFAKFRLYSIITLTVALASHLFASLEEGAHRTCS